MTYTSKEELKDKVLKDGDAIIFQIKDEILKYCVHNRFLMCDSHDNDVIFNKLKIKHKYVFASQCYGYDTKAGSFPCCNRDDYEALTKIALALFEKCEKINNQNQMNNEKELENISRIRTIIVVYTNRLLSQYELGKVNLKQYAFLSDYDALEIGQLILSPMYTTPMQIVSIEDKAELYRDGKQLKKLIIDSINGIDISKFKTEIKSENIMNTTENIAMKNATNKKSVFNNFIEKYKSQFIPEIDNSLKVSMDGNICVPINGELIGIDKNDNLISYPEEMCISVPVFLLNKPYSQVKVGDFIKVNNTYAKVLKKNPNGSLSCLSFSGYTQNKKEIKDFIFNQAFVKVVINMFGNIQTEGFNPIMLMMMKEDVDVNDVLMMQMMQKGNIDQSNLMMLAMMNKNGDNSMFETMLMMQMMQNGSNPFNMFSNQEK